MSDAWKGVSRARKCPICQHEDWCGYWTPEDYGGELICCQRDKEKCNMIGSDGQEYVFIGSAKGSGSSIYEERTQYELLRKKKILVAALAGMLYDLEMPEPEESEQPELPVMKNNDQRKAWLRDYKSWGLWYADEHIGARYYKYDFDNGARLIVEVYTQHNEFTGQDFESSYLHLVGGPEPEKHPSGAYGRWQRHETYSRYPDSETELVEFLKALQKGK